MSIAVKPYGQEHETAVAEFNRRLQLGGADEDLVFYERALPGWLPPDGKSLFNQYFVALDKGVVRGAYALKRQDFWFEDGKVRSIAYYHHPLSEGIIDRSYALVGSLLLRDAMKRSPLVYCLGMGGYNRPLPKMLVSLGWSHRALPFYFRVVRPYRFLRQMQALRSGFLGKVAMDTLAFSGVGWAVAKCHRMAVRLRSPAKGVDEIVVEEFSDWADRLWEQAKGSCSMTAVRDSQTLAILYPANSSHLRRIRVRRGKETIGWAVVGERRKDAKYGSLRVGSVVDCWALPENALPVVKAATLTLEKLGMDLIVTNQSHAAWSSAFRAAGFFPGKSNFIFAASKPLAELLQPFEERKLRLHITRADGDGLPRNF
ncbi:MAG: hypothetical protein JOZ14_07270 [Acidobacteria bacterium]|nr:hypothetical protein [Acidobacteriota bacterium]